MPTVQKFAAYKVEIRFRDHLPPHVHVLSRDGREALVEIESLALTGSLPRHELGEVLEWIRANRALLLETWKRYHP